MAKYLNSLSKSSLYLARAILTTNTGIFTCGTHVKKHHTQCNCVTSSLPVKKGKAACIYTKAPHAQNTRVACSCMSFHLKGAYILQVTSDAEIMQIDPRLACKTAYFCKQKHANRTQKYTPLHAKIHTVTGNSSITSQPNSPANCRQVSLHPADEVTRNLRALIRAVVVLHANHSKLQKKLNELRM